MNCDLLTLLQISHKTSSNEEIREVTRILSDRLKQPHYVQDLLPIILSTQIDQNTTCAALIQLKECVKKHWNDHFGIFLQKKQAYPQDKEFLINNIFDLNIQVSDNYKYGKIIKDIICYLGKGVLTLMPKIIQLMEAGQQIKTCMNFLLGIVAYNQYIDKPSDYFLQSIETVIPLLNSLIINGQQHLNNKQLQLSHHQTNQALQQYHLQNLQFEEILYLGIKFMKKCINWMSNDHKLREYSMSWALISMTRINFYNEDILNKTDLQDNLKFPRGSPQFLYFHQRKWAIKYLIAFIQKILIYKKTDEKINHSTTKFYNQNWNTMVQLIYQMYMHPSPKKMKFYDFELLATFFRTKPKLMTAWFNQYIQKVLPTYITFVKDDQRIALEDPIDYVVYEMENCQDQWNTRKKAAELWTKILVDIDNHFEESQRVKRYQVGLRVISQKLQSPKGQDKICGGYLLEKLARGLLLKNLPKVVKDELHLLAQKAICDFLREQNFFFLISALGIAKQSAQSLSKQTKQLLGQFFLVVYTNQQAKLVKGYEIVKLKCLMSIPVLAEKWFRELSDSQIEIILTIYLRSLLQYEFQEVIYSFRSFLLKVHDRIQKYGIGIVKEIGSKLNNINQDPQISNSSNPHKQVYMASQKLSLNSGMISTLSFLTFLIPKQKVDIEQALHQELIKLLSLLLSQDPNKGNNISDHTEDILEFWFQFLVEKKKAKSSLSKQLWFFYLILIFKMHGLPKRYEGKLETANQIELRILNNCFEKEDFYIIPYMKLLMVYQQFLPSGDKLRTIKELHQNLFGISKLQSLFYMIFSFYQNRKSNETQDQHFYKCIKGRFISTVLLIYLLEEHGTTLPDQAYKYIWTIINKNQKQLLFHHYLKRYNAQLLLMWVYTLQFKCFDQSITSNREGSINQILMVLVDFISSVTFQVEHEEDNLRKYFKLYSELKRGVLGFAALLKLAIRIPALTIKAKDIIVVLLLLMRKTLSVQGYNIDMIDWYDDDDQEFTTEQWMRANNFTHEDVADEQTQTELTDNKFEYQNEPNLIVDLSAFRKMTYGDSQDQDLRQLFCPENLQDESYVSKLDPIIESQEALKILLDFKENHLEAYRDVIEGIFEEDLSDILNALEKSEKDFEIFEVTQDYNEMWVQQTYEACRQ